MSALDPQTGPDAPGIATGESESRRLPPCYRLDTVPYDPVGTVRDAVRLHPGNANARSDFAWYLHTVEKNNDGARAELLQVTERHPDHRLSWARLAVLSSSMRDAPQTTVVAWERAEAVGWNDAWWLPLGKAHALLQLGRHAEAVVLLESALRVYPTRSGLYALMARGLFALERWDEAWYYAQWAEVSDPGFLRESEVGRALRRKRRHLASLGAGDAAFLDGARLVEKKHWAGAIPRFKAAAGDTFLVPSMGVWPYIRLAHGYLALEEPDAAAAVRAGQGGLAMFPENAHVHHALMRAYLQNGQYEEAWGQVHAVHRLGRWPQPELDPEFLVTLRQRMPDPHGPCDYEGDLQ